MDYSYASHFNFHWDSASKQLFVSVWINGKPHLVSNPAVHSDRVFSDLLKRRPLHLQLFICGWTGFLKLWYQSLLSIFMRYALVFSDVTHVKDCIKSQFDKQLCMVKLLQAYPMFEVFMFKTLSFGLVSVRVIQILQRCLLTQHVIQLHVQKKFKCCKTCIQYGIQVRKFLSTRGFMQERLCALLFPREVKTTVLCVFRRWRPCSFETCLVEITFNANHIHLRYIFTWNHVHVQSRSLETTSKTSYFEITFNWNQPFKLSSF